MHSKPSVNLDHVAIGHMLTASVRHRTRCIAGGGERATYFAGDSAPRSAAEGGLHASPWGKELHALLLGEERHALLRAEGGGLHAALQ